jgi:hypothetical protein
MKSTPPRPSLQIRCSETWFPHYLQQSLRVRVNFAYISYFIPGSLGSPGTEAHRRRKRPSSIQSRRYYWSLCTLDIGGSPMVDDYIIPRLRPILSKVKLPKKLTSRVQELVGIADGLKGLPLSLCHIDINAMNIILDEGTDIVGLIDWELARLLPTDMNSGCIRYLAVPCKMAQTYSTRGRSQWQRPIGRGSSTQCLPISTISRTRFLTLCSLISYYSPTARASCPD